MKIFFLGRFQPFHLGHLDALLKERNSEIIIGIGSTNKKDHKNPFPYKLRKKIIEKIIKEHRIRAKIIPIPDMESDEEWMDFVSNLIDKRDLIYSGNSYVLNLFKNNGYKTKKVKLYKNISGTLIRGLMKDKKEWRFLVPDIVKKELK